MDEAARLKQRLAELEESLAEHKRVERHLAAAYATTRVLAESATLRDATRRIIRTICETLGWEYGAVWVVDRQSATVSCSETWHASGVDLDAFEKVTHRMKYAPQVGLPGIVWASGKPLWLSEVQE